MTNHTLLDAVIAYVEAHRFGFDQAQLRARLLQDGVAPAVVEEAIARVYGAPVQGVDEVPQVGGRPAGLPGLGPEVPVAGSMQPISQIDSLVAYLTSHRQNYTAEALRHQLLQGGAPPAEIDLAMRTVYGSNPTDIAERSGPVAAVAFVVAILNLALACGVGVGTAGSRSHIAFLWAAGILTLEVLLGGVLAYTGRRTVARGFALGAGIGVGVLGLLFAMVVRLA